MEKESKGKAKDRIRKRMKKDMQEKRKSHTIQNDKWERKQYMKKSKCNVIKNAMKNRLLMWNTKCD